MHIPKGRPHYKRGEQDPKTTKALAFVAGGMSQRKAARKAGVALSTVVRAIQRHRSAQEAQVQAEVSAAKVGE
ncbi:MAG: helix-turn-helix domain-containing protein [Betaproteobacteria bacterium]